jgi:hypothetical protein
MRTIMAALLLVALASCSDDGGARLPPPTSADSPLAAAYATCGAASSKALGKSTFAQPDDKLATISDDSVKLEADAEALGRFDRWAVMTADCLVETLGSASLKAKYDATNALAGIQDETEHDLRFVWSFSSPNLMLTIEQL